jgi:hypothetical protein
MAHSQGWDMPIGMVWKRYFKYGCDIVIWYQGSITPLHEEGCLMDTTHAWWMTYWIWVSIYMQFVMMINPRIVVLKFFSFPNFHAFWDGNLRTIWNSNMELNVDDRDHMMNLCNNTTTMLNISK